MPFIRAATVYPRWASFILGVWSLHVSPLSCDRMDKWQVNSEELSWGSPLPHRYLGGKEEGKSTCMQPYLLLAWWDQSSQSG